MILTLKKRNTFTRGRFIVSVITVGFITSMLVVGSAGSLLQQASARSNNRYNNDYSSQGRTDRSGSNRSESSQNKNTTTAPKQTSEKQTPQVSKKRTSAPVQPTTTPPSTPQITRAPAFTKQPPVAPVDTAVESSKMTATQAAASATGESVAYTPSQRISEETRNRLLILAGAATIVGALLYTLSYIGSLSPSGRAIPVRYIVPVKEAVIS